MVIGKRGETILYQSDLQLRVVGQNLKNYSPSGGLEPPTFRLTVERASQLRHEGSVMGWPVTKNKEYFS